jgi:hypothetical protein
LLKVEFLIQVHMKKLQMIEEKHIERIIKKMNQQIVKIHYNNKLQKVMQLHLLLQLLFQQL